METFFKLFFSGVLILSVISFWKQLLFALAIVAGIILICGIIAGVFQYFKRKYLCIVCRGKGRLKGSNEILKAKFDGHNCYACNGKGHVFPKSTDLYSIAANTLETIQRYCTELNCLEKMKQQFQKDLVIGLEVKSLKINQANTKTLEQYDEQREYIETQIKHYQVIEKLVHLCMHEVQVEKRILREKNNLARFTDNNINNFVKAQTNSDNLKIENKSHRNYEILQAYIDAETDIEMTRELRMKIDKITVELREYFDPEKETELLLEDSKALF